MILSNDIAHHLNRFIGIYEGIKSGQFPVYIYPHILNGATSSCPTFYPDIFLLPFALLQFLGVSATMCMYLYTFVSIIVLINVFFTLSNKIFKNATMARLATLLFMTNNYILGEYFKRFALGEFTALIFVIVLGLGVYNMLKEGYSKPWLLLVAMLGLLLSHSISFVLSLIALFVVVFINAKKLLTNKMFYAKTTVIIGLFLALSFTYLAPFIEMFVSDTFVISAKPWTHTYLNTVSSQEFFSVSAIAPNFCLIPLVLFFIKPHHEDNLILRKQETSFKKLLIPLAIFILLLTDLFPWIYVDKILGSVQFPWRLNIFIIPIVSILGAYLFSTRVFNKAIKGALIAVLCIINISTTLPVLFAPNLNDSAYYGNGIGQEWFPYGVDYTNFYDTVVDDSLSPVEFDRNNYDLHVEFDSTDASDYYIVPIIYYKGYSATIEKDGKINNLEIKKHEKGIQIFTNGETGHVTLNYDGTKIQKFAPLVSLVSLIGVVTFVSVRHFKRKKRSQI
ncbi:MAG: hypothetical protein IJW24_02620 [Clostridia bacterium]|nr:hypothetical protein [Clostridia bacterium]